MANSLNVPYEAQKRQKEAKIEHKSTGVTNSINKASVDAMARADVYSPKSVSAGTDINGRNLIPTQDSYTQAAYEEYLTTGKINPGYTSLVSFDDLEAFGDAHTQKLKDGRSFYSYGTTTILDGYKFDNNALKRSKEMFEDYWDKTGSKSAKWGYDLTDPEDYRRYQERLPSKKYEEGYGDDAYSLWLKENGLGHADYFMNGSSGYYEQALFEQAELDKQVESTDAFMKEVRRRVKFIADDPFNVTMDEIYRAAEDVRYANPEYRDFSIENPGLAKKTIEDFKDYASPELAYDEYIAGLDKNRGKYGHIYLDTLYTSVTGKPYSSLSTESGSSASSSSSASGNKTAKAEEELYKEVADEFLRSGVTPASENIDKYIAKVIESDTTGKYDDVKFVEEKDYSDSTWGNVSAARDKSKGITIQEAKEGVIRAYGDMTSTEITAPTDYSPEEKAYKPVEQDKEVEVTSQPVSDLQKAIEMVQGYRADGYSEDVIKEFVTSRGLPYQDAVNAVRYQGLWTREAAKQQASTPADSAPATERTQMQENYDPRAAAETYIALRDAEEAKLKREAKTLAYMQEGASKIITGAIEKEYATPKTREGALGMSDDEYMPSKYRSAVDIAIDDIMSTGASLEETFALIQADRRLDYRDSTYYKEEQEKIESKIRELADSNAVYQLYLDVENELRQGNNQDIVPLDSVKAATEAYSALRDLGLTNAQIAEQMALHGLRMEDAEGVVPDGTAIEAPDDIHEITSAAKQRERDAIFKAENEIFGYVSSVTYDENGVRYGIGTAAEIPVFDEEGVEERVAVITPAVDDVIEVLIESKGYTREQAFSIVENYTTLKLSDSERYKERIDEYLTNKEVQNGDYSEAAEVTISDIIYRNTAKTNSESTSEKQADARKLSEAAASELYPKVLEAVGGDESLASYYMESLGLDISDVSKIQKEKAAAEKAETERLERESYEDEKFKEMFRNGDAVTQIIDRYDPLALPVEGDHAYISPEEMEFVQTWVDSYRDSLTLEGRTQFEVDNALRRNGLGFMIPTEESGAHFVEDVLLKSGMDPAIAFEVVGTYTEEELADLGETAKYSANWEDSSTANTLNVGMAIVTNGILKTASGVLGFADFLTGHNIETIEDWIDVMNEQQAKMQALAEDPNHPYAGTIAELGAEVTRILLNSKVTSLVGKASSALGVAGKSKLLDFAIQNSTFVSGSIGNYYEEALANGATKLDAAMYGLFAGAIEGLTERSVVSGKVIPSFVDSVRDSVLTSNMKAGVKSFLMRFGMPAVNMFATGAGEAYEEGLSSVSSGYLRKWTWDDHYRVEGNGVATDAALGFVTGVILGAASAPANSQRYKMFSDIYEKFKAYTESADTATEPSVNLDDLASVSYVETEVSKERYEKFKTEYEAGTIQPVTEAEFKDAISAVFTSAESSKKESRRYKEKTKSYETEEAVAAKKVESIETQLKGIFASAEARKENGEAPFSVEDAKTVKALFDKLAVAKRDFERVSADVVAKKDTAANDYSSKAQKDKESYMKNMAVVEQYFMQKCFEMDLQLFGKKAEQPAMEAQTAQTAEVTAEQTDTSAPVSSDVHGNKSIPDFAVGATRSMYDSDDTSASKVGSNTYFSMFDEGKRALYEMDDMEYMISHEEESMRKAMDRLTQMEWNIQNGSNGRDSVIDKILQDMDSGTTWGASDLDFAMGLLRKLDSEGDVSRVRELAKIIQEHGTVGGQFIQAFAKYSRTKEGMMLEAQKNAKRAEESVAKKSPKKKKKIDDETKKAKDSTKRATKEASKAVSEEVEKALGIYDIVGDAAQRLEKKIKKSLNSDSKESVDVAKKIANDLFGVAKESPLPEAQKRTKDTIEEATEAYRRSEQYRQVWEAAKNMVYDEFSGNEEALTVLRDYFENDGRSPISEEKQKAVLMRALKENDVKLSDLIESFDKYGVSAMGDVIDYLVNRSAMSVEAATLMASDIMDRFLSMRAELAEKYLQDAWKDGKARDLNNLLANMRAVNFDSTLIKDAVLDANGLPVVTDADIEAIRENMEKAEAAQKAAKNGELYEGQDADYMARVYAYKAAEIVASKEPASSRNEKLRAVSYMNMLLNVNTNVRNFASNVPMGILETFKDLPGTFIDKMVSKKLGTKRTTTAFSAGKYKQYMSGFKTGINEAVSDIKYDVQTPTAPILDDVDATTMHGRYGGVRRNPFDDSTSFGKAANRISRLTGQVMSLGDRGFARGAYEGRIAELESLGYDVNDQKVMESAMLYALDRTFQNNGELAKRMEKVRRNLGIVGDMIFPFVQTPANVADKLMDYTLVGSIKAALQWNKTAGTEVFDQKLFVDRLSRSFTGTGVMMLGAMLLKHGLITKEPEEWEEKQAMQNAGVLSYAIKVGDGWQTINWADPTSALLLMGAFFGEGRSTDEIRDFATGAQAVLDAGKMAVNVLFSNSFLSSIADVIAASDAGDAAEDLALGYSSRFTPSALAQVAQIMDSVERDTSADTEIEKTINYLMSRIPFLRKTLPVKIGTDGKVVENKYGDNVGMRAFNALLNPGNYSKQSDDPVNTEIYRLYEEGFRDHLLPSSPYKVGNVTLTAEQRREYQAGLGERTYAAAEKVMNGSAYKSADDKKKAELLEEAINSAEKKYKSEFKKTLK